jgi:cyclopropane-fatty-acyl-phospholipid synthase
MFEHVGYKNYHTFMRTVAHCLKDEGIFLLHVIGANSSNNASSSWLNRYIFPNSQIPTIARIASSIENIFVMEDWQNFGIHYDKTLMAWHHNFNQHWDELKQNYDERFRRMWNYYLLSCAGCFRARHNQLWQIVLSKKGIVNGFSRYMLKLNF